MHAEENLPSTTLLKIAKTAYSSAETVKTPPSLFQVLKSLYKGEENNPTKSYGKDHILGSMQKAHYILFTWLC